MTASSDIANLLNTELVELTLGTNLFYGPYQYFATGGGIPVRCVFCLQTAGSRVMPFKPTSSPTFREGERNFRVDIFIREDKQKFGDGEELAIKVSNALDMNPPTGYVEARTINTAPNYLRKDDLDCHLWTVSVEVMKVGTPT